MDTPPPVQQPPAAVSERQWAIGIHLSGLLGFFTPYALNIIGPLVIWLIKKPESAYLDAVGKRVLNFQISYSLYGFVAGSLGWSLFWTLVVPIIFLPLCGLIALAWLILTVVGAVKESNGETFEFPSVIRLF